MYAELGLDVLILLLAIRLSMFVNLKSWKSSCLQSKFGLKRTSCSDPMPMPIKACDPFSSLIALRPEQLATALTKLDPHVLQPHLESLGDLLLVGSKQLSLTDLSGLFLAVAELFTKEGKPTTHQLLRSNDATALWLLSVMQEMAEQALTLLDSNCSPDVVAKMAHACALVLPRHIRVDILFASFRKLLLALLKHMGTEQDHARTHTAQDLRNIFLAITYFQLFNKSYTKKIKQRLIGLAEELEDGALVQEIKQSV